MPASLRPPLTARCITVRRTPHGRSWSPNISTLTETMSQSISDLPKIRHHGPHFRICYSVSWGMRQTTGVPVASLPRSAGQNNSATA